MMSFMRSEGVNHQSSLTHPDFKEKVKLELASIGT